MRRDSQARVRPTVSQMCSGEDWAGQGGGSLEKDTVLGGWPGKASLRRGHFSKDLQVGAGAQWKSGEKVFQQREQNVQRPEVGVNSSKKPSLARAGWSDLGGGGGREAVNAVMRTLALTLCETGGHSCGLEQRKAMI